MFQEERFKFSCLQSQFHSRRFNWCWRSLSWGLGTDVHGMDQWGFTFTDSNSELAEVCRRNARSICSQSPWSDCGNHGSNHVVLINWRPLEWSNIKSICTGGVVQDQCQIVELIGRTGQRRTYRSLKKNYSCIGGYWCACKRYCWRAEGQQCFIALWLQVGQAAKVLLGWGSWWL